MNRKLQRTCRRLAALAVLLALTAGMWGVTAAAAADKLTEGVEQAAELGLVPPELLAEDLSAPITRGEFCTLLIQASQGWGAPVVGHAPHFSDTEDEAVRACAGMGIVNGYPDGTFRPDGVLTRHQAAAMLCRAAAAFGMGGSGVLMPHTWQDEVGRMVLPGRLLVLLPRDHGGNRQQLLFRRTPVHPRPGHRDRAAAGPAGGWSGGDQDGLLPHVCRVRPRCRTTRSRRPGSLPS